MKGRPDLNIGGGLGGGGGALPLGGGGGGGGGGECPHRGGSRILKVVVHPKQLAVLALNLQT